MCSYLDLRVMRNASACGTLASRHKWQDRAYPKPLDPTYLPRGQQGYIRKIGGSYLYGCQNVSHSLDPSGDRLIAVQVAW